MNNFSSPPDIQSQFTLLCVLHIWKHTTCVTQWTSTHPSRSNWSPLSEAVAILSALIVPYSFVFPQSSMCVQPIFAVQAFLYSAISALLLVFDILHFSEYSVKGDRALIHGSLYKCLHRLELGQLKGRNQDSWSSGLLGEWQECNGRNHPSQSAY